MPRIGLTLVAMAIFAALTSCSSNSPKTEMRLHDAAMGEWMLANCKNTVPRAAVPHIQAAINKATPYRLSENRESVSSFVEYMGKDVTCSCGKVIFGEYQDLFSKSI